MEELKQLEYLVQYMLEQATAEDAKKVFTEELNKIRMEIKVLETITYADESTKRHATNCSCQACNSYKDYAFGA